MQNAVNWTSTKLNWHREEHRLTVYVDWPNHDDTQRGGQNTVTEITSNKHSTQSQC